MIPLINTAETSSRESYYLTEKDFDTKFLILSFLQSGDRYTLWNLGTSKVRCEIGPRTGKWGPIYRKPLDIIFSEGLRKCIVLCYVRKIVFKKKSFSSLLSLSLSLYETSGKN
jgi:hypothetical protein